MSGDCDHFYREVENNISKCDHCDHVVTSLTVEELIYRIIELNNKYYKLVDSF